MPRRLVVGRMISSFPVALVVLAVAFLWLVPEARGAALEDVNEVDVQGIHTDAGLDLDDGVGKRCGGKGWTGLNTCRRGLICNHTNEFWWDCQMHRRPVLKTEEIQHDDILPGPMLTLGGLLEKNTSNDGTLLSEADNNVSSDWDDAALREHGEFEALRNEDFTAHNQSMTLTDTDTNTSGVAAIDGWLEHHPKTDPAAAENTSNPAFDAAQRERETGVGSELRWRNETAPVIMHQAHKHISAAKVENDISNSASPDVDDLESSSLPVVDRINQRFVNGHSGKTLEAAGVLIHQFHNGFDGDWAPWLPCPYVCYGKPCWCRAFNDRFSTTIINSKLAGHVGKIHMYNEANPGFILAPAQMKVLCAYPADGGSEQKNCWPGEQGCAPGCGRNWCTLNPERPDDRSTYCAWPADMLDHVIWLQEEAIHRYYNEIIVEAQTWVDNLPRSVEAIFYLKGSSGEKQARKVHKMFVEEYGDKSLSARSVPLLEMDLYNIEAPFKEARAESPAQLLRRFGSLTAIRVNTSEGAVSKWVSGVLPLVCTSVFLFWTFVATAVRRAERSSMRSIPGQVLDSYEEIDAR